MVLQISINLCTATKEKSIFSLLFFIMLCCCVIILLLSHQVKTYHVLLLAKASGEGQQKNLGEKMLSKSLVLVVLFFHGQGVPTSFRIFFQKHKKCNLNFPALYNGQKIMENSISIFCAFFNFVQNLLGYLGF